MNEIFEKLITNIPEYKEFLTVDEMDESSKALAKKYPGIVDIFQFGLTRGKHPLYCLKIGSGKNTALMFGCPHPNEPIGAMLLEYLSGELAQSEALRKELDYTVYIVKSWDADGLKLNEGWLKGPYTLYNYARNFFRPAGHQQVDWTFPIDYKELHFHNTIAETSAMMELIDKIKPDFIYSLHNAGFGGVYWYVSAPITDPVYNDMKRAAEKQQVPLSLGEPEAPYCIPIFPAVYQTLGIRDAYDYLEKYGVTGIAEKIGVGTCSADYAFSKYKTYTLLTELPYFYDPRISDLSESNILRKDAALQNMENSETGSKFIRDTLCISKQYIKTSNPFLLAIENFTKDDNNEATRKMIEENLEFQKNATVAEWFDNLLVSQFYKSIVYGMLVRVNESELLDMKKNKEVNPEKEKALSEAFEIAEKKLKEHCKYLEDNINYEVVSIKRLISIQLECGLLIMDDLKKTK